MKHKRVIARLDVKNDALVKGIHLEGLRVLGSPQQFANSYYQEGIDELVYMDVVASLYNRNGLLEFVRQTAENLFVPLAVGGGIRSIEDVTKLLNSGADKVIINTAAVKNPSLIDQLSRKFGSSTVVVAVEAIKLESGKYGVFIDNGREFTDYEVCQWVREVQARGAGEIMLTSVDREGTGTGLNLELIDEVSDIIDVPLIVHGGVGNVAHVEEGLKIDLVSGVCIASMFHYEFITRNTYEPGNVSGNVSFLKSGGAKKNISPMSVSGLKRELRERGMSVR